MCVVEEGGYHSTPRDDLQELPLTWPCDEPSRVVLVNAAKMKQDEFTSRTIFMGLV